MLERITGMYPVRFVGRKVMGMSRPSSTARSFVILFCFSINARDSCSGVPCFKGLHWGKGSEF